MTGTHVYYAARGNTDWVVDLSDQFGKQRPLVAHRGVASLTTVFTLLVGLVLFIGALGWQRHAGSWTRSVSPRRLE